MLVSARLVLFRLSVLLFCSTCSAGCCVAAYSPKLSERACLFAVVVVAVLSLLLLAPAASLVAPLGSLLALLALLLAVLQVVVVH